ncbi:hypothetical protein FQN60_006829 [Etheostoma spectabile]|uniref:Uncharacterized protein n=1 Tax=Etheostoma spectabile TaxID=54343 RepID=A0A5J5CGW4_9PERO|nr:hypothetical protein FQN60_006829 [Etheostoma spectabile]
MHIYRKHPDKAVEDIAANPDLDAVCIDERNGESKRKPGAKRTKSCASPVDVQPQWMTFGKKKRKKKNLLQASIGAEALRVSQRPRFFILYSTLCVLLVVVL